MIQEKYEQKTVSMGNYIDEDFQVQFYDDLLDQEVTNDVTIDEENLKVTSNLKSTIVFRSYLDFERYLKYHKNTFKANGFKEV